MTYEYDVCEGITVQHYGPRDWFPVIDAGWWVREWLMCDESCEVEVTSPHDADSRASWGEVRVMLELLGNVGPYGEEPVFAQLTYNHENDIGDELLIAAGYVDVSGYALHRGKGSPLLRAVFASMPEHDWQDIDRVYVVATARGGCYGWSDSTADVYLSPNMDDDYDIARWSVVMSAWDRETHASHPIHDECGGFGDGISDLGDTTGYPYGDRADRLPMWDVSALDADWWADGVEYNEPRPKVGQPWLACGEGGVFAIGMSGRVYPVGAYVN